MRGAVLTVMAALAATACSGAREPAVAASGATTPAAVASASAAAPTPVTAREEKVESELIDFEYGYPAAAGAIPALRAAFDADLDKRKVQLIEEAKAAQKDAREGGYEFRPLGYWLDWKVVTDLPGWLSLSADIGTYEGGAHPNHGFDSLVWDKQAGVRRDPVEMFTSPAALSSAIKAEFCKSIDAQRRKKRGADWKIGGEFDACIDPVENGTIILGSSNRKAFDRIGILVPPYNAGPYAEGDYEVTLPVTAAVLAAVKPEYRATFVAGR